MAFLVVKEESVKQEGGSNYITKSGIYPVTLKHAEAVTTTNGAVQVNYYFDKIMSYGNNIIGIDGTPTFGYKILEALATVVGTDELSDPEPTTVTFKKGSKELNCIPELNDVDVKAWIQFSYRMYKGEIQEDVSVRRFYRESDNASGSEIMNEEGFGERYEKDLEFAEEIKYSDGVTPEAVAAWKKASQGGKPAPTAAKQTTKFPGASKSAKTFPGAK
jgi:hypothetical protein